MDFLFGPEDEHFREEVRAFLRENLPPDMAKRNAGAAHASKEDTLNWTKIRARKGWAAPGWPKEFGGTGWTLRQRYIWDEETCLAGAPRPNIQAFSLVAPIVYQFGTKEQQHRLLPPILKGEAFWSQGFSEPNAGSDLASLKTRAVREGNEYVINGQKIWTSSAHYADWIFLVARTSQTAKPQEGISFFVVPRPAPGITVRPIISISGRHHLNETFYENVRIPVENLIGEENKGWDYAKSLLAEERLTAADVPRNKFYLRQLKDIARQETFEGRPLIENPLFAARIAQQEIDLLAHETSVLRALKDMERHTESPAVSNVLKIRGSELQQRTTELLVEALGLYGAPLYPQHEHIEAGVPPLEVGRAYAPPITSDFLLNRAASIYGGTNEIQRNLLSRVLLKQARGLAPQQFLTSDQKQLQESVRRFVEKDYSFETRKRLVAADDQPARANWKTFAVMGWLGAGLSEEEGGWGGKPIDQAIILEELGRGLVVEPYLAVAVCAARAVRVAAPAEQGRRMLQQIASGEQAFVLAHSEAQAGGVLSDVRTAARAEGAGYVLDGNKAAVLGAPLADRLLVSARLQAAGAPSEGLTLFLVDPKAGGVRMRDYRFIDGRRAADIAFEEVRVPGDAVLGAPHRAFDAIASATEYAIVGASAEALGAMEEAFWATRDYLHTRRQFGKALAEFQVLQHRLADMFIDLEQARSILYRGVIALDDADAAARSRTLSAVKARIAQSGRFVCGQAIQLHGGMGMTEEYVIGHYFKRLVVYDILYGNARFHLERYARGL